MPPSAMPALVVATRHAVPEGHAEAFVAAAREAVAVLSACRGFVDATVARATDDPSVVLITSRWADIGSYRRALSSYDVKLGAVPLLSTAADEPTAFEVLHARGADGTLLDRPSSLAADAFLVGLGEAAAAIVPPVPS